MITCILVWPTVGVLDGVLERGERHLLAERGGEVDAADVGEAEEQPEAIGQLVRQLAEGRGSPSDARISASVLYRKCSSTSPTSHARATPRSFG